jgi:putative NIF3 family GTP cyclohydrolase 1 type 2
MRIKDILQVIEQLAPPALQEDFDNAGLQAGDATREATGALLCIDVTENVIDEAVSLGCNLVISHHPLLFRPLKSLTAQTINILGGFTFQF